MRSTCVQEVTHMSNANFARRSPCQSGARGLGPTGVTSLFIGQMLHSFFGLFIDSHTEYLVVTVATAV